MTLVNIYIGFSFGLAAIYLFRAVNRKDAHESIVDLAWAITAIAMSVFASRYG